MPTYDYACEACSHRFEQFQSIKAEPLTDCPACGKPALQRLMGTGGGIIFKGSGFYQTDYRSESYRKAAEAEKPATSAASNNSPSPTSSSNSTGDAAAKPAPTPATGNTPPATPPASSGSSSGTSTAGT